MSAESNVVMARRATLDIAPLFASLVEVPARQCRYTVGLGGSVLHTGTGRDFDFCLIPKGSHSAPVAELRAALGRVLGPEIVPWEVSVEGTFEGAVYQHDGWLIDVSVVVR